MINEIKKELRANMNGILSARMREAGMPVRLIYGVELPRLCNIAEEFPKNADLANHLWNENIREAKLLAIMLMPPEAFTPNISKDWVKTMVTAEEAQVLAMMLLSKTSHAKETSLNWLKEDKALLSVCACLCLRHMLVQGTKLGAKEAEYIEDCTTKLLLTANLHLRKAIQALKEAFNRKKT